VLCKFQDIYALKDPEASLKYAAQGSEVYARINRPGIRASMECLRMNARMAQKDGDIDRALEFLFAAKDILDAFPASATSLRGPLLGHIAYTYYNAGLMNETISYLDQTLSLLEATGRGNSMGYLRVASNKAVTLQNTGRLTEAVSAFEDVVKRMRESGYQNRGVASVMSQYGGALVRVGRVEEAEEAYLEGIQAAEAAGDEENIAAIHMGLSNVYGARMEFDRVLESLDAAQEFYLRDENADRVAARMTKVLRTKALRRMGRFDDALAVVDALLVETGYPQAERGPGLFSTLIQAAELHKELENYDYAEELATGLIRRLLADSDYASKQSVDVARAYVQRAEIRIGSGYTSGAIEDIELAIPILVQGMGVDHKETLKAKKLLGSIQPSQSSLP